MWYRLGFSLWLLFVGISPQPAAAFCLERVANQSTRDCVRDTSSPPLFWGRSYNTNVFHDDFFGNLGPLAEDQARAAFRRATRVWTTVQCDVGDLPFVFAQAEQTTPIELAAYDPNLLADLEEADGLTPWGEPGLAQAMMWRDQGLLDRPVSIMFARTPEQWAGANNDRFAVAFTSIWFKKETGEILDVDLELNTRPGPYAVCGESDSGCEQMCPDILGRDPCATCSGGETDLENTLVHEIGHMLGLAHSDSCEATMFAGASDGEVRKRTLTDDDVAGVCTAMPPGSLPPNDCACTGEGCTCPPVPLRTKTVCACQLPGAATGGGRPPAALVMLVMAALGVLQRRRFSVISCRRNG